MSYDQPEICEKAKEIEFTINMVKVTRVNKS